MYAEAFPLLKADRRVASLAGLHILFGGRAGGEEITTLIVDGVRGDLGASMTAGRLPRGRRRDRARSADHRTAGEGRSVTHSSWNTKAIGRRIALSERCCFRRGTSSRVTTALALTIGAARRLVPDVEAVSQIHMIEFSWADGVDARRADRQLEAAGFGVFSSDDAGALLPPRVANLGEVEDVPRYLAVFLGSWRSSRSVTRWRRASAVARTRPRRCAPWA